MQQAIIIAIDGHSSCGKSTLAKDLAKALGYAYIDTGAMYRAVTLFFLRNQIDIKDERAVSGALEQINIHFEHQESGNQTFLNGENVEEEIRKMYVSEFVSPVATLSAVRQAMVHQQQTMGKRKGVVLDGRDIGTVVFPSAELKVFLTASIEERTKRRFEELQAKGISADRKEVQQNLLERDHIDSTRADSPLKRANDAILIDNTDISRAEQLQMVLALAQQQIEQLNAKPDEQIA
ncbi:MAG: (d)CMP kinase [Bacteroidota bacterium]